MKNLLLMLYVDDAGLAAPHTHFVDSFVSQLVSRRFKFMCSGTFSEYLGIKFDENKDNGTTTMMQKGLIEKIINATGMQDCNHNWTPALTLALGIHPDGPPMKEQWSYPSIVGMLLYLLTNTHPDISFVVGQVARFNHSPKQSHAQAVKMIIHYLSHTANKGTIMKPTGTLVLDCHVDVDFVGLHCHDPDTSPTSAKSHTGFIITMGGVPLVWKSKDHTFYSRVRIFSVEPESMYHVTNQVPFVGSHAGNRHFTAGSPFNYSLPCI
jgi:hypothetical protein